MVDTESVRSRKASNVQNVVCMQIWKTDSAWSVELNYNMVV